MQCVVVGEERRRVEESVRAVVKERDKEKEAEFQNRVTCKTDPSSEWLMLNVTKNLPNQTSQSKDQVKVTFSTV